MATPIAIIVHTVTSRPDTVGYTQSVADFYSPAKGRAASFRMSCHSPSNAAHLAFLAVGRDWEKVLHLESENVPVRRVANMAKGTFLEGSPEAEKALADLVAPEAPKQEQTSNGVTLDTVNRFYVIPAGKSYSTLGWDYCAKQAKALALELQAPDTTAEVGTLEFYSYWETLLNLGRDRNRRTGWRSAINLVPALIGLEGKRVEVVDEWGTTKRFWVGKSTGWMPCHLQIARRNCSGGPSVCIGTPRSVRVVSG